MSTSNLISEFIPPYLSEVDELLGTARGQLLSAEASNKAGKANVRAVRELFRAVHTIKGLSAMVDVDPIVSVAHVMESSLRSAERRGVSLPQSWIEVLHAGLATIEHQLKAVSMGSPVPAPSTQLLDALEGLSLEGDSPPEPPAATAIVQLDEAIAQKLTAAERELLLQGVRSGRRVVRVDFAPSPQNASRGLNINVVRERVAKVAEIVRVLPLGVATSELAPGGLVFAMVLLTRESDAALADAAGCAPEQVRVQATPDPQISPEPTTAAAAPGAVPSGALPELIDEPGEQVVRSGLVRVESSRLDEAMERVGALVVNRSRLLRAVAALTAEGVNTRDLIQVLAENARLLRDMRGAVVRMRMVRVSELLERLPLMVRGLRRTTGKQVELVLELGDTELDKSVGDRLFPAIVHLVRNAMDHAIESPEERRAKHKPEQGTLRVGCHERANKLELVIEDDGRGIDAAAVARRAGAPEPQSADALLELLCRPGLSTRDEVTTTSGRGMGMDIVRRILVGQLGGELQLETTPGQGTRFTARVPLTLSILDAFIFEVASQRYAVAVSAVDELVEVDPTQVVRPPAPQSRTGSGSLGDAPVGLIARRGSSIPLLQLGSVLSPGVQTQGTKAIVVQHQKRAIAFGIDRLLSQQEVVIRPLEDALVKVQGVLGATDLGDGRPTLVLDLPALGAFTEGLSVSERVS